MTEEVDELLKHPEVHVVIDRAVQRDGSVQSARHGREHDRLAEPKAYDCGSIPTAPRSERLQRSSAFNALSATTANRTPEYWSPQPRRCIDRRPPYTSSGP